MMHTKTPIASIVLCAGQGPAHAGAAHAQGLLPRGGGKAPSRGSSSSSNRSTCRPIFSSWAIWRDRLSTRWGPKFPNALFAFQAELRGTGHATKQGAAVLRQLGFQGGVLVIAGDKVVEQRTLDKLVRVFAEQDADMALVVAPKHRWPDAGRLVTDENDQPLRIVEKADIVKAEESGATFDVEGKHLTAAELDCRVTWINQAIYLYKADVLFDVLEAPGRENVQKEEYLTDSVEALVRAGRKVALAPVDDPDDVLGFNSPEELLQIEEHFRRKAGIEVGLDGRGDPRVFKTPETWARALAEPDSDVMAMLHGVYGYDGTLCEEKRARLLNAVELFIDRFGTSGRVAIVRAPGRVNMMGRHVDHRGGHVNLMAIDREQIFVARPREDGTVHACNADEAQFPNMEFSIGDLLKQVKLEDWREFVNSDVVTRMVRDLQGDWGNYLKAPFLRLQQQYKDRQIRGVDTVVLGDIPMAAGLSSSSALVVAMADALVLANGLDVSPSEFVDVCGEGEWFVGTRGGSADHAAVKLSQIGQVAHVGFFPFAVKEYVPFPEDYSLVVCNSRIQARKAAGARDIFNERVACYEFGVRLVRKRFASYAPAISHLRDISPEGLGLRSTDIYRILLEVPERITPKDLVAELGEEECGRFFATHKQPEAYAVRACLLYGIAECARSSRCIALLRRGDMEKFGWLMNVSHDGDRVVYGNGAAYACETGDVALHARIDDLMSEDPDRVLAGQLYAQPGGYACSLPEIDRMVDIALATKGVLGAQLAGAGLGGCMMVLARKHAVPDVMRRLEREYYEPNGLEPGTTAFTPIAGCSALSLSV